MEILYDKVEIIVAKNLFYHSGLTIELGYKKIFNKVIKLFSTTRWSNANHKSNSL